MKSTVFALFATAALAQPVVHHQHDKRALVTNVVHATKVLYQNQVIYVDEQNTPWSTGFEPVSTAVNVEDSQPSAAAAATQPAEQAPTTVVSQPQPTTQAVETSQAAPQAPTQQKVQEPQTSEQAQQPTTQAPPPTTQSVAQPTTSSASKPAPTTSSSSDDSSDDSSSGGSGETFSGDATYYTPGLGACGEDSTESDMIVALNHGQFAGGSTAGGNSNYNTMCGKKIEISRGGKTVKATVVDMCPGCDHGSLDLSPAAFDKIADQSEGRVEINWKWVS